MFTFIYWRDVASLYFYKDLSCQMERRAGIPSNRIIVGGFSQGLASSTQLSLPHLIVKSDMVAIPNSQLLNQVQPLRSIAPSTTPSPWPAVSPSPPFSQKQSCPNLETSQIRVKKTLDLSYHSLAQHVPPQIFHFSKRTVKWTQSCLSRYGQTDANPNSPQPFFSSME